ncbi:MAG: hypothetical protein ACI94Y_004275 [Maribacter sp.]|jgi:hypothetical protein
MENDKQSERITFPYLWKKILSVLNFEKGLPFTIWQFVVRPGKAAHEYLFGDRKKFMDPVKFTVLAIAIGTYILLNLMSNVHNSFGELFPVEDKKTQAGLAYLGTLVDKYYNLFLFLNIPMYAIMTKILFKKKQLHLAEHIVINAYLYAVATYATIFLLVFPKDWAMITMNIFSIIVSVYIIWAYKKIFEESWLDTIVKGIIVLLMASFLYFFIVMFVLGIVAGYHVASLG